MSINVKHNIFEDVPLTFKGEQIGVVATLDGDPSKKTIKYQKGDYGDKLFELNKDRQFGVLSTKVGQLSENEVKGNSIIENFGCYQEYSIVRLPYPIEVDEELIDNLADEITDKAINDFADTKEFKECVNEVTKSIKKLG